MLRLLLALLATSVITGCGYNTIQSYDERVNAEKQQIEVMLQRRYDLIPNLVETVRGQAQQELEVFTQVTRARAGLGAALQRGDPRELANANAEVTSALRSLTIAVEAYPNIKSDQAYLRLQDELAGTENRIATARTDYNQAVQQYNTYIRRFPAVMTAKVIGAKPREYFEVSSEGAREAPKVDFSR